MRHLLSIVALPFLVTVGVPLWIARHSGTKLGIAEPPQIILQAIGVAVLGVGLALFVSSLRRFATEGQGTLAPWDPPRELVVRGPYRHVRNPMISGVFLVLVGEALLFLSWPHGTWAAIFFVINAIYIPLIEEPQLADRFGPPYENYRRHVPRLIPRLRPWQPSSDNGRRAA